jgi:hypothetical protein
MRVVLAKEISPLNVNIAMVKGEKIRSDDVLQFKNLAGEVTENQLPIFTEARVAQTIDVGGQDYNKINILNNTLNPEVTNQYNFIKDTAETIPLWNKYTLKNVHFNNSLQVKTYSITESVADIGYNILSQKADVLMCENTIVVKNIDTGAIIDPSKYVYNNCIRELTLKSSIQDLNLLVYYFVINNSIILRDDLGNKIDSRHYRIEPRKYETTPNDTDKFGVIPATGIADLNNIYDINILLANVLEPDRTYFVEYLAYDKSSGNTNTEIEVINEGPIYTKVPAFQPSDDESSNVFVVDDSDDTDFPIYTFIDTSWPKVFVKYPTDRTNKITLVEPDNVPHDLPWFIEISNDKLTRTIDTVDYTYRPVERISQNIINDSYQIKTVKEDIIKVDSLTIKTQYNNLHLVNDNTGTFKNITIVNDGANINNLIEWIDAKQGLIRLSRSVNISQANNYIEYRYKVNNVQYNKINLNPFMIYNESNNAILDKFIVVYIMPEEELDITRGRSIFHSLVYKNPERYENVEEWQKSIDSALTYINGESSLGHEWLYNQIKTYINPSVTIGDELHPIILGYISASNISTPASMELIDVRRRGGGVSVNNNINELDAQNERHYLDIAKYDGYDYDLSNVAIVTVKNSVKDRIINILSKYDVTAQRLIRDNVEAFNIEAYAESYMEQVVQKYLNAGCKFTIQYED